VNRELTVGDSLIASGSAMPFTAHATSPTITMPRIKAITTGSIPSFLDVILNFAESDTSSALATQDTWLAQMKAKKTGKLVMYGDDTWLKLFPETFDRADGTSSFFVAVSCVTECIDIPIAEYNELGFHRGRQQRD
jgi:ethanolaminephosphotransferase